MAKKKAGYILYADPDWVDFHLEESVGLSFCYSRGLNAPMKNVEDGGRVFFFKRGDPEKRLLFWGRFQRHLPITPRDAWAQFDSSVGNRSYGDYMKSLEGFIKNFGPDNPIRLLQFDGLCVLPEPVPIRAAGVKFKDGSTKGKSIEREDVNAIIAFADGAIIPPDVSDSDHGETEEGKGLWRLHYARERSPSLVRAAKDRWRTADPNMPCECCGFSFVERFGPRGESYIEAHHTKPLAELKPGEVARTRIEDLASVCANCHRMLHRNPAISVAELAGSRLN